MNKDPKVSNIQIRGLIVSTVIGVGVLSLPHTLVSSLGNKGWISIILSGALIIPVLYIITRIFIENPGKDFFQIGEETLGKILFKIVLLILAVYFIFFCAYVTRNLGELIKAFLLPTTPLEIIIFSFILVTSYIASQEIDVIARTGYFIYPLILFFAVLIVLIALPKADFSNLLPINNISYKGIPKGIMETFFSFAGFEMIFLALPYVEQDKETTFKSAIYAIIIITIIYLAMFIMSISHFSIQQLERQGFPILQLVKQIDLPGFFLENLDGLVMSIWVIVVFTTFAPAYFGAGKVITKIFGIKTHKYIVLILIPIIYKLALYPENLVQLTKTYIKYFNLLGFISGVIIPVILLVVGLIRKKVGN